MRGCPLAVHQIQCGAAPQVLQARARKRAGAATKRVAAAARAACAGIWEATLPATLLHGWVHGCAHGGTCAQVWSILRTTQTPAGSLHFPACVPVPDLDAHRKKRQPTFACNVCVDEKRHSVMMASAKAQPLCHCELWAGLAHVEGQERHLDIWQMIKVTEYL